MPRVLRDVREPAGRQRAQRRGDRAREVVPREHARAMPSEMSCDSAACSMERNGPTSFPLGLITPTMAAA